MISRRVRQVIGRRSRSRTGGQVVGAGWWAQTQRLYKRDGIQILSACCERCHVMLEVTFTMIECLK